MRAILEHTSLEKLRISSVEPMDWSDSFIGLMAESPRIAKHAHVPMQSGSDAVLRRMHRKYRPWHYREKIEKIRTAIPTAAIGADVMVGFPGETDWEFEETRRMIEELPFTYLHVFTFSARPGTPADSMPNQVPVRIARERNRILRELAAEKKHDFMREFVGQKIEAITLNVISETGDGIGTEALTDNYLKMKLIGHHDANQWLTVDVTNIDGDSLIGNIIREFAAENEVLSQTEITPEPSPFSCGRKDSKPSSGMSAGDSYKLQRSNIISPARECWGSAIRSESARTHKFLLPYENSRLLQICEP